MSSSSPRQVHSMTARQPVSTMILPRAGEIMPRALRKEVFSFTQAPEKGFEHPPRDHLDMRWSASSSEGGLCGKQRVRRPFVVHASCERGRCVSILRALAFRETWDIVSCSR